MDGEGNEEVLERGYDNLSDDDDDADGRGLEYACEGNPDVFDGLSTSRSSSLKTATWTSYDVFPCSYFLNMMLMRYYFFKSDLMLCSNPLLMFLCVRHAAVAV